MNGRALSRDEALAVKRLRAKCDKRRVELAAFWHGRLFEVFLSTMKDGSGFEFTLADRSPELAIKAADEFLEAACPPKAVGAPLRNQNRARRAA